MTIEGTAGQLETDFDIIEPVNDIAIICHPHPQYGGSMHDNVVAMLADGFRQSGISTVKFNFRGVGASDGQYDDGKSEVSDVLAVINWCSEQFPQAGQYICGYSFGAVMALNALAQLEDTSSVIGSILVAPPVQMDACDPGINLRLRVILGEEDDLVPRDIVGDKFPDDTIRIVPGTDHFFMGKNQQVIDLTREFIDAT